MSARGHAFGHLPVWTGGTYDEQDTARANAERFLVQLLPLSVLHRALQGCYENAGEDWAETEKARHLLVYEAQDNPQGLLFSLLEQYDTIIHEFVRVVYETGGDRRPQGGVE